MYCGDDPIDRLDPSGHDPALTGMALFHEVWVYSWGTIGAGVEGAAGTAAGSLEGGIGAVPGGILGGINGGVKGIVIGEITWGWINNGIKWFRETGERANKYPKPVPDPWNYPHPFGYFAE